MSSRILIKYTPLKFMITGSLTNKSSKDEYGHYFSSSITKSTKKMISYMKHACLCVKTFLVPSVSTFLLLDKFKFKLQFSVRS